MNAASTGSALRLPAGDASNILMMDEVHEAGLPEAAHHAPPEVDAAAPRPGLPRIVEEPAASPEDPEHLGVEALTVELAGEGQPGRVVDDVVEEAPGEGVEGVIGVPQEGMDAPVSEDPS